MLAIVRALGWDDHAGAMLHSYPSYDLNKLNTIAVTEKT